MPAIHPARPPGADKLDASLDEPVFEQQLAHEIVYSERLRMLALATLAGALVVPPLAVLLLRLGDTGQSIKSAWALQVVAVLVILAVYELTVRAVIGRRQARGKSFPRGFRYLNVLVETSVPSVLILIVAQQVDPLYPLHGAPAYLYAVFVVLSILRLDFRLSVFTGCVAGLQYLALALWLTRMGESAQGSLFADPEIHISKAFVLAVTGLTAGFVADQLKRRVLAVHGVLQERQRIVNAFGQQVSTAIVDELLRQGSSLQSKRVFVCVMFMDIRDFTRLMEGRSPEDYVAYQNAVFSQAIDIIDRNHGVINQFMGDGFMATFGAPVANNRECQDGLAAARELLAAIKDLSDSGRIPPTRIGIGLHAGDAVTGNIGSGKRQQYSISGNVVVLASRIDQLNKAFGSQILVSAEVLQKAGQDEAAAQSLGLVQVKGLDEGIEIFRLA